MNSNSIGNLALSRSNEWAQICPPLSNSSLQGDNYEVAEKPSYQDSTSNTAAKNIDNQTGSAHLSKGATVLEKTVLESIAIYEEEIRNLLVSQLANDIKGVIQRDEFIDGEISNSESYMKELCAKYPVDCILKALMQVYSSNLLNSKILEGVLVMVSCVSYETAAPDGQVMAMGLLSNRELEIRDRAIQCFEKWNSKKGIPVLKSLDCHPKWLQKYVEKVITYLERDGTD